MYCIKCQKNNVIPDSGIKGIDNPEEMDVLWLNEERGDRIHTIDNEMVSGGIIQIISAGYGSTHDGDKLIIAICDSCIESNLEDGTILYFDNYMFKEYGKESVEKSKKIYLRRKNLDNLTDENN
mgnify:FL=1